MTTMKEVAERTGVSVSTVSLVLNDRDEGRVKPAIAEQVRATAKRLGYRPNPLARSLRTSKTRILGFISEEIATLKRYGVDGFLYAKMSNRFTDVPKPLHDYPLVLVDATDRTGRYASIEPDETLIGYDATKRLIDACCASIAYIGCSEPMLAQQGRLEGYRRALLEAGMPFDESLVVAVPNNGPALQTVTDLFERRRPDGYFCFNDARAWYVYENAARRGLVVGRDVSVVGVDNHRVFAETLEPQLTTVELPHYEMGYWATRKLVSLIEGREPDDDEPETTAPLPPLDASIPAKIHCTLIDKQSVAQR